MSLTGTTNAVDLHTPHKAGKRLLGRLSSISLRRSSLSKTHKHPRFKRRGSWSALGTLLEPDEYLLGLGDVTHTYDRRQGDDNAIHQEPVQRIATPTPPALGRTYRIVNPDSAKSDREVDQNVHNHMDTRRRPLRVQDPRKRYTWNAEVDEPLIPLALYGDDWDAPRRRQRPPYPCSVLSLDLIEQPSEIPTSPPQRPPPPPPTFTDLDVQSPFLRSAPPLPNLPTAYIPYRSGAVNPSAFCDDLLQRRSTVRVPVGTRVRDPASQWQSPDSFTSFTFSPPPVRQKPLALRTDPSIRSRCAQPSVRDSENLDQPVTSSATTTDLASVKMPIVPPRPRGRPPSVPQKPAEFQRATAAPNHSTLHQRLIQTHHGGGASPAQMRQRSSFPNKDHGIPGPSLRSTRALFPNAESRLRSARAPPAIPPKRFSAQKATPLGYQTRSTSEPSVVTIIHRCPDSREQPRPTRQLSHAGVEAFVPRLSGDMERDSYEARFRNFSKQEVLGASPISPVAGTSSGKGKHHGRHEYRVHDVVYDSRSWHGHYGTRMPGRPRRKSTADDLTLQSLERAVQDAYPESSHNSTTTNDVADVLAEAGCPAIVQAVAATYPLFTSALVNARDHTTRSPTEDTVTPHTTPIHQSQLSERSDSKASHRRRDSGYISMQSSPTAHTDKTPSIQLELPGDDVPEAALSTPFNVSNKILLHVGSISKGKQKEVISPLSNLKKNSPSVPEEIWFDASAGHPAHTQPPTPPGIVSCMACAEDLPKFDFSDRPITTRCTHENLTCRSCAEQWLHTQLDTTSWDRLGCMQCTELLTYDDVLRHGNAALMERYDRLATRALLSADKDFRWCRGPGCDSGQVHEGGEATPIFHCRACNFKFCVIHEEVHEGMSCQQFEARLIGEDEAGEESIPAATTRMGNVPGSWPQSGVDPSASAPTLAARSQGTVDPIVPPTSSKAQRDEAAARALQDSWEREEEEQRQGLIAAHRRLLSERQAITQAQIQANEAMALGLQAELDHGQRPQAVSSAEPSVEQPRPGGFLAKLRAHRRDNPPPTLVSEPAANGPGQSIVSAGSKLQYKADSSARAKHLTRMADKHGVAQSVAPSMSAVILSPSQVETDASFARQLEQAEQAEIKRAAAAAEARRIANERKLQAAAAKQAEAERKKVEDARRRRAEEAKGVDWVQKNSKQCPNAKCGFSIQKKSGCDHMTCSRCKHEFCWECLADYRDITRTDNTAHQRNCRFHR
nr:hypothetical protein B0A51_18846 [Rachicladosporium sp. CCFEE 5018]